jgi:phenylalanyl-tRNA synthetase beta subunit
MSLSPVFPVKQEDVVFVSPSKFPSLKEDLTFEVSDSVLWLVIHTIISSTPNLESFKLISVFKTSANTTCFTVSMVFRGQKETLTKAQIRKEIELLQNKLKSFC